MNPMNTFDPTRPATVHDRLNDKTIEWKPEWAEHYREHAIVDGETVGWDGLILDGWHA